MRVKLYRKWVNEINHYVLNSKIISDEPWKTLNDMSEKMYPYVVAYNYWISRTWYLGQEKFIRDNFKHKYRKYSRKYWTSGAMMMRDLRGESQNWVNNIVEKIYFGWLRNRRRRRNS